LTGRRKTLPLKKEDKKERKRPNTRFRGEKITPGGRGWEGNDLKKKREGKGKS